MSNSEGFYPLSMLEEKSDSVQFFASYRKEKSPIMMKSGEGYFITDENGKDLSIRNRETKILSIHSIFSKNFLTHWRSDFYKPYHTAPEDKKIGNSEYFYFTIRSPYGCL